jgi:hypothetical protein
MSHDDRPQDARTSPVHPKLEAAYAVLPEPRDPAEALRIATIRGLLYGYHHRWLSDRWHVEAIESEFHIPIMNPETRGKSRRFTHAGKFDGIVSRNDEAYLLEHKTTSEDLSPGSPYWKRLTIDTQISGYLLATWADLRRLLGVLYDAIRKPEIQPRKLTARQRKSVLSTRAYYDIVLSDEIVEHCHADPDFRETTAMYEARLRADTLARPDWYFARSLVTRLEKELVTYAEELWQTAHDIRRAERAGDIRRNDKACMAYGRPCEFLDLCAGHDSLANPRWQQLERLHPELKELTHDGRTVLTHTRIATFATCRRKHYYRYELGVTRWEKAEPLVFGTLLHAALAAWWQAPADVDADHPDHRHDTGQGPAEPCAGARGPGLGQDQPGGDGSEPGLPHDQK